jgi:hypothetical protein
LEGNTCHIVHKALEVFRELLESRYNAEVGSAAAHYRFPLSPAGLSVYYGAKHNILAVAVTSVVSLEAANEDLKIMVVWVLSSVEYAYVFCHGLVKARERERSREAHPVVTPSSHAGSEGPLTGS